MRIPHAVLPKLRLIVVLVFVAACTLFSGYLWVQMGGQIKGVTSTGYRVAVELPDVDNLVYDSDVMVAGVKVGKVRELELTDGRARAVMQIRPPAAPLHEGATVQLRAKTLVEESYLEIVDGHGPELPDGIALPASALKPSVQLHDVLTSLDPKTRAALGSLVRSTADGTAGRREDIDRALTGLGALGREGHDALDALAAQSEDLTALARETTTLLQALDARQGRLVQIVEDTDRLAGATAGGRAELEATVRRAPALLAGAGRASGKLTELSTALAPVAADLDAAAPHLSRALTELPPTARDLRGVLPALDGTLLRAPATLTRVPAVSDDARALIGTSRVALADVNPMLGYLQPYGRDIAAFFTNWAAMMQQQDPNGHYVRVFHVYNEQSLKGNPVDLNRVLDKSNAYPRPGGAAAPGPFQGRYPRVQRDRP
jgi:phospholipid/cholesterol/gamma-HCH transport system substrate-binding protein